MRRSKMRKDAPYTEKRLHFFKMRVAKSAFISSINMVFSSLYINNSLAPLY